MKRALAFSPELLAAATAIALNSADPHSRVTFLNMLIDSCHFCTHCGEDFGKSDSTPPPCQCKSE